VGPTTLTLGALAGSAPGVTYPWRTSRGAPRINLWVQPPLNLISLARRLDRDRPHLNPNSSVATAAIACVARARTPRPAVRLFPNDPCPRSAAPSPCLGEPLSRQRPMTACPAPELDLPVWPYVRLFPDDRPCLASSMTASSSSASLTTAGEPPSPLSPLFPG
jgi:hypothetical protein